MNRATLFALKLTLDSDVAINEWMEQGGISLQGNDARLARLAFHLKNKIPPLVNMERLAPAVRELVQDSLAAADWFLVASAYDLEVRETNRPDADQADDVTDTAPFSLDSKPGAN